MGIDYSVFKGLDDKEVADSRAKYGENVLTPAPRDPWWRLLLEKFDDPIIRILIIAAVIAIVVGSVNGHYVEGIGIIVAVLLATLMSFFNEFKAGKEFDILNKVNDDVAVKVIRNGNVTTIPKRDVVVGDYIIVEQGEEIPSDGTLLQSVSLLVNESALTGEPVTEKFVDEREAPNESTYPHNMLLKGSVVVEGNGVYVTTSVGDSAEIGKTAREATIQVNEPTPLASQLERLSKLIGVIGFGVSAIAFWAYLISDILQGEFVLTVAQWFTFATMLVAVGIALSKVWVPMLSDFFEIIKHPIKLPAFLCKKGTASVLMPFVIGGGVFLLVAVLSYFILGIDFLHSSAWFSLEQGERLLLYFMVSITLIVVAVPEGLAMSVTLSLAYSMRRMTATNNLVRKMQATETMGAATVICTDKTGTLTQNKMKVVESTFFLSPSLGGAEPVPSLILGSMAVNSTAHLDFTSSEINVVGNPTDGALLLWLHEKGIDYRDVRRDFHVANQLSFSSELKYMASLGYFKANGQWMILVKGAPDILVGKCANVLTQKGALPLTNLGFDPLKEVVALQNRGMRTIGFAYKPLTVQPDSNTTVQQYVSELTLLGFVGIADPIRLDVAAAIADCKTAGIEVKVVTGDTSATALEIGRQIGLIAPDNGNATIGGAEFEAMPDSQAAAVVNNISVMYRARPSDKLKLVRLLQANGEIVAVTGDGTNDAPALNKANVGLSMGSGTSVAKEASDIILLDDSFASIVNAVKWGRSLYQNIQHFLLFQLTINLLALLIVLIGPFIGVDLPLTVTQMLWVNLIMDTFAALALATEPPHAGLMNKKPRRTTDFILTKPIQRGVLVTALLFFVMFVALLVYMHSDGIMSPQELTFFFNVFVLAQLWNLFNARAFGTSQSAFKGLSANKNFILIVLSILLGQIVIVQFGGAFFRTVPLSLNYWIATFVLTFPVIVIGEIFRLISRKLANK
ncbi:MAG: calcium-translocating P-type ATPase, PMCA-type [Bacteroidales bacterium]|nr:calcium-translocating P-type ATPase, PMCA-type [Bacteroidales bacterium]MBN2750384.1 calcium-translocating P-type ATPase, PMCA-type [Bacteroidales bacterium]